ncbi:hypothetical protein B4100_0114 [Heyndrickxia coagulans]|nr:hypothetical protein B4100_0114 [Heyndrickxia coagulans]
MQKNRGFGSRCFVGKSQTIVIEINGQTGFGSTILWWGKLKREAIE